MSTRLASAPARLAAPLDPTDAPAHRNHRPQASIPALCSTPEMCVIVDRHGDCVECGFPSFSHDY